MPWHWAAPAAATVLLAARVARLYEPHLIVDDAFISFRYADNLAHGLGLVYNAGERVEGYSNFLWTLLLAAGARLGLDIVQVSIVLALAAALATVVLLGAWSYQLFGRDGAGAVGARGLDGRLLAALPPLLYAATGSQARFVLSGMETLLFGFLVALAAYLLVMRQAPLAAGGVFGLAAMTRPEGAMYCLVALALTLLARRRDPEPPERRRRRGLLLAAGFTAVFGGYFVWRCLYYGDPLPNTFYAKAAGFSWGRIVRGLQSMAEVATTWSIYPLAAAAAAALPALASRRERAGISRGPCSLELSAVYVAVTVVYFVYVGGDFLFFFGPRFLMPVLPFLLLLAAAGLRQLAGWTTRWAAGRGDRAERGVRARRRGWQTAVMSAGAALLLANALWLSWPARYFDARGLARLMESWEQLGRWLGATVPPPTVIADGGAGIVPFYSRLRNIDMYGLADRHIGHMTPLPIGARMTAHEKYDPRYVLGRRPDLLITALSRTSFRN